MQFRPATVDDLEAIVALLHDDVLGVGREDPSAIDRYRAAFTEIDADTSEMLVVVERDQRVIGTMQLSVIPGLSRQAVRRLQIEGVRVSSDHRGEGVGDLMIGWAVDRARELECGLVQLTSDRQRTEAHRFYEGMGFEPSHVGYKLDISGNDTVTR